MPASYYGTLEGDAARQDNELCRTRVVGGEEISITGVDGRVIRPLGDVTFTSQLERDYWVACFSSRWNPEVGGGFDSADACLVVHDPEALLERMHAEIERVLPGAITADASVSYGKPHGLGVCYSKPVSYADQCEYRLTALAPDARQLSPWTISIGSIEDIAEIVPSLPMA
jgi:hypothetical protein